MEEKEFELAEQLAEQERINRIEIARRAIAPQHDDSFDGKNCIGARCGQEIPKERLAMGRIRCVHCQTLLERQTSFRGR